MTNGGTPPLRELEDVLPWAIHQDGVVAEKLHQQEGWNERQESWMQSQEERIQEHGRLLSATGVSVRFVVGGAALISSLVASLIVVVAQRWAGG